MPASLQTTRLGRHAGVPLHGVAANLAADGAGRAVQHPSDGANVAPLLEQAGLRAGVGGTCCVRRTSADLIGLQVLHFKFESAFICL